MLLKAINAMLERERGASKPARWRCLIGKKT